MSNAGEEGASGRQARDSRVSRLGASAGAALRVLRNLIDRQFSAWAMQQSRDGGVLSYEKAAELARQEWIRAVAYFDEAHDPDLIDYASFSLQAAERKYVYLLKKAREEHAVPMHMSEGQDI